MWVEIKDNIQRIMLDLYDILGVRFDPYKFIQRNYLDFDDNKEGEILFLLTEDSERGRSPMTPHNTEVDLVQKPRLADKIANQYGIRWTHMVDIGSGLLLLKWASETSQSEEWKRVYLNRIETIVNSYKNGHDIQLHLHSYNIPYSPDFRWRHNPKNNSIYFEPSNYILYSDHYRTYRGWASSYKDFGDKGRAFTRVGSLIHGKNILEGMLKPYFPEYRTIFFRAGGYDFGDNKEEVIESFEALSEAQFLAGSNLTKGSLHPSRRRTYEFSAAVDKNVFEVGIKPESVILEILPTAPPILFGFSWRNISPLDHPKVICEICQSLIDKQGKVKPGIHIILENFHIHTINIDKDNWDTIDPCIGDWKNLEYHFKYLKEHCNNKMSSVTVTQALNRLMR
jgi:hypothetical protein